MVDIVCLNCGKVVRTQRRTRKYCSVSCANRAAWAAEKTRECRHCGTSFPISGAADANRQHCSKACAKAHNTKRIQDWKNARPGYMAPYNEARKAKNPGMWRDKHREERQESIRLLGGRCLVCGVTNPNWLHVDYIPTTRDKPYRHPRHIAYVRSHLSEFRLLCANHHYELTLTGTIEGTDLTQ